MHLVLSLVTFIMWGYLSPHADHPHPSIRKIRFLGSHDAEDCWWTGCQLNSWATVGCEQYGRYEKNRTQCVDANNQDGFLYHCCVGGGGGESGGDASSITLDQFNAACATKGGAGGLEHYNNFKSSFQRAKITGLYEAAKYLAHTVWESNGMQSMRELFCQVPDNIEDCKRAYGTGLGGVIYYGRGPIQLSHDYNYRGASIDIFGTADVLLNDPDRVASDFHTGWDTAAYFWGINVHQHNQTFGSTLKAINGALECQGGSHSQNMWIRCDEYRKILGIVNLQLPDRQTDCYCTA